MPTEPTCPATGICVSPGKSRACSTEKSSQVPIFLTRSLQTNEPTPLTGNRVPLSLTRRHEHLTTKATGVKAILFGRSKGHLTLDICSDANGFSATRHWSFFEFVSRPGKTMSLFCRLRVLAVSADGRGAPRKTLTSEHPNGSSDWTTRMYGSAQLVFGLGDKDEFWVAHAAKFWSGSHGSTRFEPSGRDRQFLRLHPQ